MKNLKKLMSLVLVLVLSLSLTNGFVAKAAVAGITVTLRIANEKQDLVYPTQVTLDENDLSNDFGLGEGIGTSENYTMLRALAKYFSVYKKVSNENMLNYINGELKEYGFYLDDIKIDGENSGLTETGSSYWALFQNQKMTEVGIDSAVLQDGDTIEILEEHNAYVDNSQIGYGYFDEKEASISEGETASFKLYSDIPSFKPDTFETVITTKGIEGAQISVYSVNGDKVSLDNSAVSCSSNGNVYTLKANKAGTYYIRASKNVVVEEKEYSTITLAAAKIVVKQKEAETAEQETTTPTDNDSISSNKDKDTDNENEDGSSKKELDDTPITPPALSPQAIAVNKAVNTSVKKLAAPKKFTAKVSKKKIALKWKKVKKAKGYIVYIAKSNKGKFKKFKETKKTKLIVKKDKGRYYFKVAAYTKSGGKKVVGKKTSKVKVIVK